MTFKPLGFTLIEILISLAFMMIISSGGYFAFIQFNKTQSLTTAYDNINAALEEAKSSAVSQVKPTSCSGMTLTGYQVTLTTDTTPGGYKVEATCLDSLGVQRTFSNGDKTLPQRATVSTTANPIQFLLSGSLNSASNITITVSSGGQSKAITVSTAGLIQ